MDETAVQPRVFFLAVATKGMFRERPEEQGRRTETLILDIHSQPMDLFSMIFFEPIHTNDLHRANKNN